MKAVLPLRFALGANALFSFVSGLLMLLRPSLIGGWLGVEAPLLLQIVGFGLLIFTAELVYQAARPRILTWRALLASAAALPASGKRQATASDAPLARLFPIFC
jgi:hypothetical protein